MIYLLDSSSSSWWYAFERSNLLKTVEPFRSAIKSSMVGIRCFPLDSFICLPDVDANTYTLVFPGDYHHGVGPVTPMTSISLRRFNSASTSFLTWKGILRCRCVTGGTEDSIWRLIVTPEISPILQSNSEGNSSGMGTDTWNVKLNVIMPSTSAEWVWSNFPSTGILQHRPLL